jgi:hypothetical protein
MDHAGPVGDIQVQFQNHDAFEVSAIEDSFEPLDPVGKFGEDLHFGQLLCFHVVNIRRREAKIKRKTEEDEKRTFGLFEVMW